MRQKLVKVKWEDAIGQSRGQDVGEAAKSEPIMMESVGWLLSKNRRCVTIVGTLDAQGQCLDRNTIPRSTVKEIIYLEERHRR